MFQRENFIERCRAALPGGQRAIRDLVQEAVQDRAALIEALGEPTNAGIEKLHHAPDLTILKVVWAPNMTVTPHTHEMWAVIGVYAGAEDNIFWRRGADGKVEAAGAKALRERDVVALGQDVVHSVTNPTDRMTAALHVYGGDFFATPRKEWDPQYLTERDYDVERTLAQFAEANRRYHLAQQ